MDEESEDEESLNFYDFVDILEKNGWYYSGWSEVTGRKVRRALDTVYTNMKGHQVSMT